MSIQLNTKHYRVQFPVTDCSRDFGQFARDMDGEMIDRNELRLSGRIARGIVKKSQTEAGCCMRAWNLFLNQPIDLHKRGNPSDDKNFSLLYIMTPDSCQLTRIGEHRQYNQTGTRSILMAANNTDLHFEIQPHQPVQIIDISVASFWIALQFQKAGLPTQALLERIQRKEAPIVLTKASNTSTTMAVNELFDAIISAAKEEDHIKACNRATAMVIDFLNRTLNSQVPTTQGNNDAHFLKVMEAEVIMQSYLQRNLPNVSNIAQQVSLSESTLKRHFKVIFGKSMYEYYLDKKMTLAKQLMLEKPLTVSETASMLGYEKVSNFIEIFKKHHGFSPGSMKKKGFTNL